MGLSLDVALTELVARLCLTITAYENRGEAKGVQFCGLIGGETTPLDYCGPDNCGMAFVRLTNITTSTQVDGETAGGRINCAVLVDANVEVGIARCAPGVDDFGNMPTEADHLEAALAMAVDAGIVLEVISCGKVGGLTIGPGAWNPFGPDGGCVGGVWTATIEVQ